MSRSDSFPLERQLVGRDSHPLRASALARRTIIRDLQIWVIKTGEVGVDDRRQQEEAPIGA